MNQPKSPKAKGGHARAAKLSPEARAAIARDAAAARWNPDMQRDPSHPVTPAMLASTDTLVQIEGPTLPTRVVPRATHRGTLEIGNIQIQCYVLEDGRRVLAGGALLNAIGLRGKKAVQERLLGKTLKAYVTEKLQKAILSPIDFAIPGSTKGKGYEAWTLPEVCNAILDADNDRALQAQQQPMVQAARLLSRALATVGIVALVDEATGYQYDRARDALAEILQAFLREELAKWAKTFPDQYYQQLFRLRNLSYSHFTSRRPVILGKLTNDIVYERLAPGVLDELKRRTPKTERGNRKYKFHQWLTADIGHPALREHLASVITLMKASPNWTTFIRLLDRALPKHSEQMAFPEMLPEDIY